MYGILRNEKLISTLFSAIKNKKTAGCYIIEGEDGSGKKTIARLTSAFLSCKNSDGNGPCLECKSCKNIMAGCHIDITEISPENGKKISVDTIREMLKKMSIIPSESDYRVFIINHSEEMKKEAQNALLKSIEEPSKNTVFFLLTNDKSRLLPTVRSRAVKLCTDRLSPDEIAAILQKRGENIRKDMLPLDISSVGKAEEILKSEDFSVKRKTVENYFGEILKGASFNRLCSVISPQDTKRDDFKSYLSLIKNAVDDIISRHYRNSSKPAFFTDENLLNDFASVCSVKNAVILFDLTENLLLANDTNINIFSSVAEINLMAKNLIKQ